MVIVVMSSSPKAAGDLARRIAVTLGWPCVDATSDVSAARDAIVRAHDRREHSVLWSAWLSRVDRRRLVEGIARVRVVEAVAADARQPVGGQTGVRPHFREHGWHDEEALLTVSVEADPDGAIAVVRDTFGV